MKRGCFLNEKISITISPKDSPLKKPVCFVVRRVFLLIIGTTLFGLLGVSAYAAISAHTAVQSLSDSVESLTTTVRQNADKLALADSAGWVRSAASVPQQAALPAVTGDEAGDRAQLSDPWLTIEYMPEVESVSYENGSVNGHVELIDWFDGGAELYSKQTQAVVIDVATGQSFHVRRFGGQYHGDSDPLTAADTAAMKQIVGGEWTWDRRPVWLKIGDRYIAASMNGMPHMVDPSPDNDFDGHFCIHLLHSRVHETGEECARHQAAVMEAFASADKLEEYLKTNQYE